MAGFPATSTASIIKVPLEVMLIVQFTVFGSVCIQENPDVPAVLAGSIVTLVFVMAVSSMAWMVVSGIVVVEEIVEADMMTEGAVVSGQGVVVKSYSFPNPVST